MCNFTSVCWWRNSLHLRKQTHCSWMSPDKSWIGHNFCESNRASSILRLHVIRCMKSQAIISIIANSNANRAETQSGGNWEGNKWILPQGRDHHGMENQVLTAVIATAGSILIWMAFTIRVCEEVITSVLCVCLSGHDSWTSWAGNIVFFACRYIPS